MTAPYAAHDTVAAAMGTFPDRHQHPSGGWPWGREQEEDA